MVTVSETIGYVVIGIIVGMVIALLIFTWPIVNDLKFVLSNMECKNILDWAFEFESNIPQSVYDKKDCFR